MVQDYISRCAWVALGPDPAQATCTRCEDVQEPPPKMIPFAALEAYVNGFAAVHSICPDPDQESGASRAESRDPAPSEAEEPSRQVDDVLSEPMPPSTATVARRTATGAVFVDCRVHGTRGATVSGGYAVCGAPTANGGKCAERAALPAKGTA